MKIKYLRSVSDLHNEFDIFHIPELLTDSETVLLLPGDIHVGDRTLQNDWLINLSKRFAYVLYVLGNHEHYKESIDKTAIKIRDGLDKQYIQNVFVLDNEMFVIPGTNYKVFGGTAWTDFNKGHPVTMYMAEQTMNDYKKIRTQQHLRRFTAAYALGEHRKFTQALRDAMVTEDGYDVIIMSHHAPHSLSSHPMYANDYHGNACYCSDLSDLILDNPKIKLWFHGHMHNSSNYFIGDNCNVICNPRGYHGHELNDSFNPLFVIEL